MTYQELISKISEKRRFCKEYGADISARLLREAGIDEEPAPFIHVAGTNGKGSVVAMVDFVLREAEFKVGRFTSPHLVDFCERIAINGEQISQTDAVRIGEKVLSLPSADDATMFDIALMMAVLYFEENNCDFWLMETGLGGLHDSTNALGTPIISVITSISLDHEEQLGHTIAQIAKDKAGIIKEGCVAVTGPQDVEAMKVIRSVCEENDVFLIEMEPIDDDDFVLGTAGVYQKENAGIAIGVINVLCDIGVKILPSDIDRGFKKAFWPGRMEIFDMSEGEGGGANKILILDGAHNPAGARALAQSLKAQWPGERFCVCFGCSSDKAADDMIEALEDVAGEFVFTKAQSSRAKEPGELSEICDRYGIFSLVAEEAGSALSILKSKPDGMKCVVCGSLYLVGEVRGLLS